MGRMTYSVVTTFSEKGYEIYGGRMVETFAQFWPADVPLYVYYEGKKPPDASDRATWMPLDADTDRQRFMSKYTDTDPRDYRTCVVRYSHKVWAMTGCPRTADNLIYIDGDVVTIAPVTHGMIKGVCPDVGQVCSFLDRPQQRHTETGFLAFRLNSPTGWDFLDEFRRMYTGGDIFNLSELHDCMAFDYVRRKFQRAGHKFKNLCPGARGLSVFEQSRLNDFMIHNKGPERKIRAYGATTLGEVA